MLSDVTSSTCCETLPQGASMWVTFPHTESKHRALGSRVLGAHRWERRFRSYPVAPTPLGSAFRVFGVGAWQRASLPTLHYCWSHVSMRIGWACCLPGYVLSSDFRLLLGVHLLIPQIFTEHRHSARHHGMCCGTAVNKTDRNLFLVELLFSGEDRLKQDR